MTKLNRHGFQMLIDGDLQWLAGQPKTLERDHIEAIVREAPQHYYPPNMAPPAGAGYQPVKTFDGEPKPPPKQP